MLASERLGGRLRSSSIALVASAWSLAVVFAGGLASTLAEESAGYQVYALQSARAQDVESLLAPLMPAGSEVVADHKGNRILVRGPEQSQLIAQRVVASLDRARSEKATHLRAVAGQPVLKAYPCTMGNAKGTAARLQEEYGRDAGVRIVADERTSQVLVLATPEVQARIGQRLGPGRNVGASTQSIRPASASNAEYPLASPPVRRDVQLTRITGPQLESALGSIFAERLIPAGTPGPNTGSYRVKLGDGNEVALTMDRATGRVMLGGLGNATASFEQLIRTLDLASAEGPAGESTRVIPLKTTRTADAQRTVEAIRATNTARQRAVAITPVADSPALPLPARLFQGPAKKADDQTAQAAAPAEAGEADAAQQKGAPPKRGAGPRRAVPGGPQGENTGLVGSVQIEMIEGLDILVIRGNRRDVQQVVDIIQQIEKLSVETEPAIEVHPLEHADCSALSTLVNQLYTQVFQPRQGAVTILPLVKPNALLLVGRKENVQRVVTLVKQLDVPVSPDTQFQVFRLKYAPAASAQTTIEDFYADRATTGLGPAVRVTSDVRSNALIVYASPRDMAEVASIVSRIDTKESEAVNELRVFKLTNTVAADLAQTLSDAIQNQATSQTQMGGARPGSAAAARTGVGARTGGAPGTAGTMAEQRSSMLQFLTVDAHGQRRLSSGILTDVRVTYDVRANTVLVAAPAESMPLIEALVKQLDQPPAVRAEVKVFAIVNGDASALVTMLSDFFGQPTTGTSGASAAGAVGGPMIQTAAREGESSLVPLRFAADPRTNSIIASGISGDLLVIEAMLMRLDATDVRNRVSTVYRLKNAPATDVANAINNFLRTELQAITLQTTSGALLSPFEQIEHQVVVVPESVSNSLIVAATPRYFEEIKRIVEDLDKRPPMVMIQVLIAEVDLTNDEEFGVEFGLQDKLLFNRGVPPNPGFLFNTATLGNDNTALALSGAERVGTQGLTNFGVGRSTTNGFGGLVLQASSESVSVLIRALKASQRVDILARPQVQTLDNQTAYINVGQSVPQISGVSLTQYGQTNNIQYTNTGIILGVTPRISPDGIVVMEIDANRSDVGPEAEGIPISVSATGQIIRAPRINQQLAQTTISATDGQTVVLGGLINKVQTAVHRQVPYLGDVPVLGRLFRFDTKSIRRTELLIIMTPHIVRTNEDAEVVKRTEAARMHWCLADVVQMMGESGLRGRTDDWPDGETKVIYPDGDPRTRDPMPAPAPLRVPAPPPNPPDAMPAPEPTPFRLEPSGAPKGSTSRAPRDASASYPSQAPGETVVSSSPLPAGSR